MFLTCAGDQSASFSQRPAFSVCDEQFVLSISSALRRLIAGWERCGGGRLAVVMDRFSAADFEFHMWYCSARNPDSTANEPIVRALAEGPANGPVFGTVWRSAFHGPLFETSMRSSCLGRNPGSGASEPTVGTPACGPIFEPRKRS